LHNIADQIEAAGGSNEAVQKVVEETLRSHYRVVFNGNNYSDEWHKIATERGLLNSRNTVEALSKYLSEKNYALLESVGVFSRREIQARATMAYEAYVKAIAIEAQACLELSTTHVLPAAWRQQQSTAESINAARACGIKLDFSSQEQLLHRLSSTINELINANDELTQASEHHHSDDVPAHAEWQRDKVVPAMRKVRSACDRIETMVDDSLWPLPKYHEMLFLR
jgi:glutamine synthetase